MTEKINIMEHVCLTCGHERTADRPNPCNGCFGPDYERRNWSPAYYCPGDCEAATKLREELDSLRVDFAVVRARAEKAEAERDELADAIVAIPKWHGYRRAEWRDAILSVEMKLTETCGQVIDVLARAEKAEAEVARLRPRLDAPVPTEPGWYWAQIKGEPVVEAVEAVEVGGCVEVALMGRAQGYWFGLPNWSRWSARIEKPEVER